LDDPFTQVCLNRLDTGRLESAVELYLLGGHRFGFGHQGYAMGLGNRGGDLTGFYAIAGPMDLGAGRLGVTLKGFEVLGQPGQGRRTDGFQMAGQFTGVG